MIDAQDDKSQFSTGEIVLVREVCVIGDEDVEPSLFGGLNEFTIGPACPANFRDHFNVKPRQNAADTNRHAFIEQDAAHRLAGARKR